MCFKQLHSDFSVIIYQIHQLLCKQMVSSLETAIGQELALGIERGPSGNTENRK